MPAREAAIVFEHFGGGLDSCHQLSPRAIAAEEQSVQGWPIWVIRQPVMVAKPVLAGYSAARPIAFHTGCRTGA